MLSTRLSLFTVFFMMASVSWAKFANWKEYCDQNIGPKNQYHYVGDYLLNQFDTDKSEDNRKEMLTEAVRLYCRAGLNGAKVDPDVKAFKEKHHPSWDQIRPFHEKEKAVLKFFGKAGYLWENDAAWFAEGGVDSIKEKWIAANALSAKSSRESLVNWAKDDSMKDFLPGIKERAERDEQRAIDLKNGAQKTASWENILYKITTIWDEEAKKDSRMDDRDKNMEMDQHLYKNLELAKDPRWQARAN